MFIDLKKEKTINFNIALYKSIVKQKHMSHQYYWKSNNTNDTHSQNIKAKHSCPYCKCSIPTEPGGLYISKAAECKNMTMTFAPSRQSNKDSIKFNKTFTYSPRQTNVTFFYISPPKFKKHHSSQAKFNTKKFKQSHFPFIGQPQQRHDEIISAVVKYKKRRESFSNISRNQIVDFTNKEKISSRNFQNNYPQEWIQKDVIDVKSTPIQLLKQRYAPALIKPSVTNLQEESLKSEEIISIKRDNNEYNKRYPTIKSINIYKKQNELFEDQTSLNNFNEKEKQVCYNKQIFEKSSIMNEDQLANSIMQELQLNYDYYYPDSQTDRSVSFHVEL